MDSMGLLLVLVVTAASMQDRDGAFRLLAAVRERFSAGRLGQNGPDAYRPNRPTPRRQQRLHSAATPLGCGARRTGFTGR
ncbi:hypothetical protein [Mycobacterium sp.]|uniref:hypothetical protein n=1 Tax=Mycobacterium sp. TaxID=1785 RepID=UPI00345BE7B7